MTKYSKYWKQKLYVVKKIKISRFRNWLSDSQKERDTDLSAPRLTYLLETERIIWQQTKLEKISPIYLIQWKTIDKWPLKNSRRYRTTIPNGMNSDNRKWSYTCNLGFGVESTESTETTLMLATLRPTLACIRSRPHLLNTGKR